MNKTKRKIITISPISSRAKRRFIENMDSLHSCYVESETETIMMLCSVNKKYHFVYNKNDDMHWKIVK